MAVDISGIIGSSDSISEKSLSSYMGAKKELGKDEFLTLLVAQMRYQDPLNPMDSSQFTSQLAQFSSLEQMVNVNTHLESINASEAANTKARAIDYMGKDIVAQGDKLNLEEANSCKGGFKLDEGANCAVSVLDSAGNPVTRIDLGWQKEGQHVFEWDGSAASIGRAAPGAYSFEVQAVNQAGDTVEAATRVSGCVTRVNMEGSSPVLYVGEIPIVLSEVIEVSAR